MREGEEGGRLSDPMSFRSRGSSPPPPPPGRPLSPLAAEIVFLEGLASPDFKNVE